MSDGAGRKDVVLLAHGGGGLMTRKLIEEVILGELENPILKRMDDAACISIAETELAMTTDSYVIDPVFFPGGDIGYLAVCGTVNDLAMQGAEPRFLSLALIIEEGFRIDDLKRIIGSVGKAARSSGVSIVTGDTKVIERSRRYGGPDAALSAMAGGQAGGEWRAGEPGIFLNTTGIGARLAGVDVSVTNAKPGDVIIITGTMGDHGMAIMNTREGLKLSSDLASDVQPLWSLIKPVLDAVPDIHCMRDPTRGGVAAAVCDIARSSGVCIRLSEKSLPVKPEVLGSCSILGLDPLNVANEGKAILVCAEKDLVVVLEILRAHPAGRESCAIGKVIDAPGGMVLLETTAGGERIVDVPTGEDLPRIC